MSSLSITSYIDTPADLVRARLGAYVHEGPAGTEIDVSPSVVGLTELVVRVPWHPTDDAARRATSLAAARLSKRVTDLAAAA